MSEGSTPTVGEAIKGTQNGTLPLGTVEEILGLPPDLKEEVIPIPEWGCSVRVRAFTAAQANEVKQRGLAFKGDSTKVAWEEMELIQFQMGVIEPRFSEDQVRELRLKHGARAFARVIDWLDEQSGTDKEEMRKARDEFHGPED